MDIETVECNLDPARALEKILLPDGGIDERAWYPHGMDDFRTGRLAIPEAGLQFYLLKRGDERICVCNAYMPEKKRWIYRTEARGRTRAEAVRNMIGGCGWEDVTWTRG